MTYIVTIRYFDGNLAEAMIAMRTWLDRMRIAAERFDCCSGCPGLAFRIAFKDKDHAVSFAATFGGCLEGADPWGGGLRWTCAPVPSACEADEMTAPELQRQSHGATSYCDNRAVGRKTGFAPAMSLAPREAPRIRARRPPPNHARSPAAYRLPRSG